MRSPRSATSISSIALCSCWVLAFCSIFFFLPSSSALLSSSSSSSSVSSPPVHHRQRRLEDDKKGKAKGQQQQQATPTLGVAAPNDASWLTGGGWMTVSEQQQQDPGVAVVVVDVVPPAEDSSRTDEQSTTTTYPDPSSSSADAAESQQNNDDKNKKDTPYDRATICDAAATDTPLPTPYGTTVPFAYTIQANAAFSPSRIPHVIVALLREAYLDCSDDDDDRKQRRRHLQNNNAALGVVSVDASAGAPQLLVPAPAITCGSAAVCTSWSSSLTVYTDRDTMNGSEMFASDIDALLTSGKALQYAQRDEPGIVGLHSVMGEDDGTIVAGAVAPILTTGNGASVEEQKSRSGFPRWGRALLSVGCVLVLAGAIFGSLWWYYGDADHLQFKMLGATRTGYSDDDRSSRSSSSFGHDEEEYNPDTSPTALGGSGGPSAVRVDDPTDSHSCAGFGSEVVLEQLPHAVVSSQGISVSPRSITSQSSTTSPSSIVRSNTGNPKRSVSNNHVSKSIPQYKSYFTPMTLPHEQEILPHGTTTTTMDTDDPTTRSEASSYELPSLPSFRNLTPRTIAAQRLYDVPDTVQL